VQELCIKIILGLIVMSNVCAELYKNMDFRLPSTERSWRATTPRRRCEACSTSGEIRNEYKIFSGKLQENRILLDGRITFDRR
jgi:hypothetical protein